MFRTQSKFSFKVRMKRSATPLPSGSRTEIARLKSKVGEITMDNELLSAKIGGAALQNTLLVVRYAWVRGRIQQRSHHCRG